MTPDPAGQPPIDPTTVHADLAVDQVCNHVADLFTPIGATTTRDVSSWINAADRKRQQRLEDDRHALSAAKSMCQTVTRPESSTK
jgi:hypothetical protein